MLAHNFFQETRKNGKIVLTIRMMGESKPLKLTLNAGNFCQIFSGFTDKPIIEMDLRGSRLTENLVHLLGEQLLTLTIDKLCLSHVFLSQPFALIRLAPYLEHIKTLDLSKNELTDDTLISFLKDLKAHQLESLDLTHNQISNKGFKKLIDFFKDSPLKSLYLVDNLIDDNGATLLKKLLKQTDIKHLALSENRITSRGKKTMIDIIDKSIVPAHLQITCQDFSPRLTALMKTSYFEKDLIQEALKKQEQKIHKMRQFKCIVDVFMKLVQERTYTPYVCTDVLGMVLPTADRQMEQNCISEFNVMWKKQRNKIETEFKCAKHCLSEAEIDILGNPSKKLKM